MNVLKYIKYRNHIVQPYKKFSSIDVKLIYGVIINYKYCSSIMLVWF